MTQPTLILASASPRRLQILRRHGIEPQVVVPDLDEAAIQARWDGRDPSQLVVNLAQAKARRVLEELQHGENPGFVASQPTLILAADTIVYSDGRVLGKPGDEREAVGMLMGLMGRAHEVYTGVALLRSASGGGSTLCDRSTVYFDRYDEAVARSFVREEQPYDKAGSYAIQGPWSRHVTRIEGDFENVMGLPWHRIAPLLEGMWGV